jgi:RimJ/RimL family protein N-acetyltransferase
MIEHEGLTLRPWVPDDASWVYWACQDPEIQRWTTVPAPYTALDAAAFVRRHARAQPSEGGAHFAIVRTETGEAVGSIAFTCFVDRLGEVGYWIAAEARGGGAAAVALEALCAWGARELGLRGAYLRVAPGNLASRRVAEKAGFVLDTVVPGDCHDGGSVTDALVYRRSLELPG